MERILHGKGNNLILRFALPGKDLNPLPYVFIRIDEMGLHVVQGPVMNIMEIPVAGQFVEQKRGVKGLRVFPSQFVSPSAFDKGYSRLSAV